MQTNNTHKLDIHPFQFSDNWLYFPNVDIEYRYILGTLGCKPLIVIGLNPSTATPEHPDPTIRRIKSISEHNGFDSFIMLNLYPQRATVPANLDVECNSILHEENLKALRWSLNYAKRIYMKDPIPIWLCWGNQIKERTYLSECWLDMHNILLAQKAELLCISITKDGQPIHPLYQKNSSQLISWSVSDASGINE